MDLQPIDLLKPIVHARWFNVFLRAFEHSTTLLTACARVVDEYVRASGLPADKLCFVAVGSVGRHEALSASDLDLVPVLAGDIPSFTDHDREIRRAVREALGAT